MIDVTVPASYARGARVAAAVIALLLAAMPRADAGRGNPTCAPAEGAVAAIDSPVFVADRSHPGVELDELFVVLANGGSAADARGGLRRFTLKSGGTIVDADGAPVVDASSGSVRASVREAWRAMPSHARVYTDLERGPLLREANALATTNAALTPSRLGLAPADAAGRARLLGAALATGPGASGRDAPDSSAPATAVAVVGAAAPSAVVFVASGQGDLRAVDAASGAPLWTFVPIAQLAPPRESGRSRARPHAGGFLQLVRLDASRAAVFGAGARERTFLVFSGESGYFGFDVSEPRAPLLLWRAGAAELRASGAPTAPVSIARMLIKGVAQNPARLVAV